MIVIGSYAAKLGGFLPAYRNDEVRDIDLVCTADELVELVQLTDITLKQVFPDKFLVFNAALVLEINVYPVAVVEAMEALCEVQEIRLTDYFALDCFVADPEVIWATLYHRVKDDNQVREKSKKDLEHYQGLVNKRGKLGKAHRDLADFYRRRVHAEEAKAEGVLSIRTTIRGR